MTGALKKTNGIKKLTYSALCLALAMVLPFLTGQIPEIGRMLSPLHIPALLCGFICGWPWGLAVGFISPLLRSMIFHMPPVYTAIAMAFELAAYGAISGLMYRILPKKKINIYVSLLTAMVAGRIVWGAVQFVLAGINNTEFTFSLFIAGAITSAVPAIILQIVLIPVLVMVAERTKIMLE